MGPKQLEQATLRPYLFVSKLCSADSKCIRERVLQFNDSSEDDTGTYITCLDVIPGGRFAVTGSTNQFVDIWDLGDCGLDLPVPRRIARMVTPSNVYCVWMVPVDVHSLYRIFAASDMGDG